MVSQVCVILDLGWGWIPQEAQGGCVSSPFKCTTGFGNLLGHTSPLLTTLEHHMYSLWTQLATLKYKCDFPGATISTNVISKNAFLCITS